MPTYRITDPETGKTTRVTSEAPLSDAEIASAVGGESQSFGDLALSSAKKVLSEAPGKMLDDVTSLPGKAVSAFNTITKPSTALQLAIPGGGTVVGRLGAAAMGKMLDEPSASPTENLKTASRGIVGDPSRPLSMATSPAAVEVAAPVLSWLYRATPYAKGRIAESQAQGVTGAIRRVSPELADAIEGAKAGLAPTLKGGKTSAAMQEAALSQSGQRAISAPMERGIGEAEKLVVGDLIDGPALRRAYDNMTPLAREELLGAVDPSGFTVRQAQEILGYIGNKAFSQAMLGQGVGPVPIQQLREKVLNETVAGLRGLNPAAAEAFLAPRPGYSAGVTYLDMLRSGGPEGPFRGFPNKIMLDENLVRRYISENRAELVGKLGEEGFRSLLAALGGAQPGTKSLLTPGAGGPLDALMATLGRGTNTGTMSLPGGVARMPLSNVGSQYTGEAPYTLPPQLRAILDAVLPRAGGAPLK